ncbi:MAG: hypothetical protein IKD42_01160 [Kiritimatiellae bacterium]|nr:hypothetical protein [Kiritimatiellia bacterium]
MGRDLEKTLAGLGGDYAEMVSAMKNAFPEERLSPVVPCERRGGVFRRLALPLSLAAAAALAVCVLSIRRPSGASSAVAPREYTLAFNGSAKSLDEIVRTQRPDGGWGNDFLTAQNAAALKAGGIGGAPYLRALRYLRSRGLDPIGTEEFRRRKNVFRLHFHS